MRVRLLRNMSSRGVECDRCAPLSPSRPAASSGARHARPAPDCNPLRAGVFATPLHLDDRKLGLRWRPRARQISRVLDGVFLEPKTRQRPRDSALVDMPPRVVALPDAKKTLLHGKLQRRHVSDGACVLYCLYFIFASRMHASFASPDIASHFSLATL